MSKYIEADGVLARAQVGSFIRRAKSILCINSGVVHQGVSLITIFEIRTPLFCSVEFAAGRLGNSEAGFQILGSWVLEAGLM